MAAPATPPPSVRTDPFQRWFTDSGCSELIPLMKTAFPVIGVLFSDVECIDPELDAEKANARLKLNSTVIVALLKRLSDLEEAGQVAAADRKVLAIIGADAADAGRLQHARFARAVKGLYLLECSGGFAPRSTGRASTAPGSVLSSRLAASPAAGVATGASAAPAAAQRAEIALKQAAMIAICELQMGCALPVNSMPLAALIQLVHESWQAAKPRAVTLAEAMKLLGPRESATDYVAGEDKDKADSRATRISAEFLRLLLAYAIGTAQALPATIGGCDVSLASNAHLDGGTGLTDRNHVLGLKVCMALLVHMRFTLATRNASFYQSYELRSRLVGAMVRRQSPASSAPVTITVAFAEALDDDDLKLASAEDAKAAVPAAEKEKKKEEDKKDDADGKDDDAKKKKKGSKSTTKGTGKGKGKGDNRSHSGHWSPQYRRRGRDRSRSRSPDRRGGGRGRWSPGGERADSRRGDRDRRAPAHRNSP